MTLAALTRGRIGPRDAVGYWIAQVAGGVIAGVIAAPSSTRRRSDPDPVRSCRGGRRRGGTADHLRPVLRDAQRGHQQGPAGQRVLRAGDRVHRAAGAFAVGGISGGLFNPAVTLGGATAGLFAWSTIWVYLVVQLGAGIAAGLAFLALNPGDRSAAHYTGGPNSTRPIGPPGP